MLLVKLRGRDFVATGVESIQVRLLANRFLNLWTVQEKAHLNGLLPDNQFAMIRADVVTVMNAFPAPLGPWASVSNDQPLLSEHVVLEPSVEATAAMSDADQRR